MKTVWFFQIKYFLIWLWSTLSPLAGERKTTAAKKLVRSRFNIHSLHPGDVLTVLTPAHLFFLPPSLQSSFLLFCWTRPRGRWSLNFTLMFNPRSTPSCLTSALSWLGLHRCLQHTHLKMPACSVLHYNQLLFLSCTDAGWSRDPASHLSLAVQPLAPKPSARNGSGLCQQRPEMFGTVSKAVYFPHVVR